MDTTQTNHGPDFTWPHEDTSQVPFRVYTDADIYAREQTCVFRGPTWNFLCLAAELPLRPILESRRNRRRRAIP